MLYLHYFIFVKNLLNLFLFARSQDSSVAIITRLPTGRPSVVVPFPSQWTDFSLLQNFQISSGFPPSFILNRCWWTALSPLVNWPRRVDGHSPLHTSEVATETIDPITFFRGVDSKLFLLNLWNKTQNSRRSCNCRYRFANIYNIPVSVPKVIYLKPLLIKYQHQQWTMWRIFVLRELFDSISSNTYLKNNCVFFQPLYHALFQNHNVSGADVTTSRIRGSSVSLLLIARN